MSDTLNILLVDDNPDDRAAAMRELRQAFPDCQFHHAANSKDLVLAIECGGLDLVITDYHLGWTDGITVLLSVKARNPDCPVIMFTGRGNEDVAVRAMKAGLDDYVLKSPDQSGRLLAAVQMSLEQAKQHEAFDQAVLRYRSLVDDFPFGLFILASGGRIIEANAAVVEMLRCTCREALLATNILALLASTKRRRELQAALKRTRDVRHFEAQFALFDGSQIWVEMNLRAISNGQDEEACYEGSLQDITARKPGRKRSNGRARQFDIEALLPVEF